METKIKLKKYKYCYVPVVPKIRPKGNIDGYASDDAEDSRIMGWNAMWAVK